MILSHVLKSKTLQVLVRTTDIKGGSTDANVYLTLYGQGPDGSTVQSGDIKLENSATNFQRGKVKGLRLFKRRI